MHIRHIQVSKFADGPKAPKICITRNYAERGGIGSNGAEHRSDRDLERTEVPPLECSTASNEIDASLKNRNAIPGAKLSPSPSEMKKGREPVGEQ